MNEKIFIIAGTVNEAKAFRSKKIQEMVDAGKSVSLSNFVIFDSLEQFRGWNKVHGFFIGSYKNRPDLRDIVQEIKRINNLHPSETVIPGLYVGNWSIPHAKIVDPVKPFPMSDTQVSISGAMTFTGYHTTIKGEVLSFIFDTAPDKGAFIQVSVAMRSSGLHHASLFVGDGKTNVFTMKVC